MPRRYSFLLTSLFIAAVLLGLVWAGMASQGRGDQRAALSAASGPATDTPAAPAVGLTTASPQAIVAAATETPPPPQAGSSTPSATSTSAVVAPSTASAPTAGAKSATPTAEVARVDTAGPIALPTIQPLPIGQGRAPVRLLIPALDLDTPVLAMGWHVVEDANGARSEWDVVDNAAGHHIDSVYPGEAGNVVLSGHNNIGGAVFRSVCVIGEPGVDFGLGDEMILQDEAGRSFVYQVEGWQRFAEANASIAQRQANALYLAPTDRAQLTLITCWPPRSNTHRVVVTGLLTGMR